MTATAKRRRRASVRLAESPQTKQFTVHEAKTNLSRLLDDALAGHTVIIARRDKPLVRLEPLEPVRRRVFGSMKGIIGFDESFFDPLPEEELKAWEGD